MGDSYRRRRLVHPVLRLGSFEEPFQSVAVVGRLCALCHVIPVLGRVRHLDGEFVMLFREETTDPSATDFVGGDDPDRGDAGGRLTIYYRTLEQLDEVSRRLAEG